MRRERRRLQARHIWEKIEPCQIKRRTSSDMFLAMQWMAVTFRATCFGPLGLWSNPSGALTPGKVIGLDWTKMFVHCPGRN